MAAPRRGRRAAIEAGAVETEQTELIHENSADEETLLGTDTESAIPPKMEAELTGGELADLRIRNEITDKARDDAKEAQDAALHKLRVAQLLQSELTHTIRDLINKYQLSEGYSYTADLSKGRLVPVEPPRR